MYGDGVCATINGGYEALLVRTQTNSSSVYKPISLCTQINTGLIYELILLCFHSYIGDCCIESCPLFRVLRHRMPSSPLYRSDAIRKLFALSRVFLLSSGGKSIVLAKKKAPSSSGFSLSTHVVLKTRYVNPISTYVDIRSTYIVQTYQPLVHNFYPYVEQQPNRGYFTKLYGISPKLYSFLRHPI